MLGGRWSATLRRCDSYTHPLCNECCKHCRMCAWGLEPVSLLFHYVLVWYTAADYASASKFLCIPVHWCSRFLSRRKFNLGWVVHEKRLRKLAQCQRECRSYSLSQKCETSTHLRTFCAACLCLEDLHLRWSCWCAGWPIFTDFS